MPQPQNLLKNGVNKKKLANYLLAIIGIQPCVSTLLLLISNLYEIIPFFICTYQSFLLNDRAIPSYPILYL